MQKTIITAAWLFLAALFGGSVASAESMYLYKWDQGAAHYASFETSALPPPYGDAASYCGGKSNCTVSYIGNFLGYSGIKLLYAGTTSTDAGTLPSAFFSSAPCCSGPIFSEMIQAYNCSQQAGCDLSAFDDLSGLYIYLYNLNTGVMTLNGAQIRALSSAKVVLPQSGWWWNPAESGRGYSIEISGNMLFMGAYLYDTSGRAAWYISSGPLNADGSYSGQLQEYTGGQTLTGSYQSPSVKGNVSPVSLNCTSMMSCSLKWAGGTVPIQRYVWDSHPAPSSAPQTGWWWNAGEPGRGFFLEQQGNTLFVSGFMYDSGGDDVWYVGAGPMNGDTFLSTWMQFANGQTLTGTYKAPITANGNVGSLTMQFFGADSGTLTLPDGRTLGLTRYRF